MKLTNGSVIAGVALAMLSFAPRTMPAAVVYDNLTAGSGAVSAGSAFVAPAPEGNGPLGDSFSTGSTAASLTEVKSLLEAVTPSDGHNFTVSLFSNSSNSLGSLISTIGTDPDSVLTTTLSTVDFTVASPIALATNTRYWIELTSSTQGSAQWSYDATNVGTGVASEYNYYAGSSSANSAFTPYQMEVTVASTATPEPASWALLVAGLAFVPVVRRKFRCWYSDNTDLRPGRALRVRRWPFSF